jgi:hypothetical protein
VDPLSDTEVSSLVAASSVSTLCWVDAHGQARAHGVVALLHQERPAVAFTYADEPVAREVTAADTVTLALTDTRSTGTAFRRAVLTGRPTLVEDPRGELYVSELVVQELRRYPPSRLFADSPLLMREHWWYLPRLVVELDVAALQPLDETPAADHLLVVAQGRQPVVRTATTPGQVLRPGERTRLDVPAAPPPGRAVLFGQDATFPDLEQWEQWRYVGSWDGEALVVEESPAQVGVGGRPPGLLARWRRQRELRRRCVAAIPQQ